jgi:hypothetical protein
MSFTFEHPVQLPDPVYCINSCYTCLPFYIAERKKNCNFDKPKKLSHLLMTILQTDQKYLVSNDIKALLRKYIAVKKLQVLFVFLFLNYIIEHFH